MGALLAHLGLDALFRTITNAGSEPVLVLLIAFVYWSLNRALGIQLMYVSGLGSFALATLKLAFAIPRPVGAKVTVVWPPDAYTFPSGHAQASTATFGYIAVQTRRLWLRIACVALIPMVAFSRVYLGVHYPQDVIGGVVLGAICVGLFTPTYPRLRAWVGTQSTSMLLTYAAFGSAVLLGIGSTNATTFAPSTVAWVYSGFFAGANLGLIWERKFVRFTVDGSWAQRVFRWMLGMVLVIVAFGICQGALYLVGTHVANEMRWLQFACVGLVFTWGTPWTFVRVGLCAADRSDRPRQTAAQRFRR